MFEWILPLESGYMLFIEFYRFYSCFNAIFSIIAHHCFFLVTCVLLFYFLLISFRRLFLSPVQCTDCSALNCRDKVSWEAAQRPVSFTCRPEPLVPWGAANAG
jgi:hypothetical protein